MQFIPYIIGCIILIYMNSRNNSKLVKVTKDNYYLVRKERRINTEQGLQIRFSHKVPNESRTIYSEISLHDKLGAEFVEIVRSDKYDNISVRFSKVETNKETWECKVTLTANLQNDLTDKKVSTTLAIVLQNEIIQMVKKGTDPYNLERIFEAVKEIALKDGNITQY